MTSMFWKMLSEILLSEITIAGVLMVDWTK